MRNATPVESYPLHPEQIPDDQYLFDPTHSQQTRLEVYDALGVAKTVSYQNYENTLAYATNHKHIDIDKLKSIATQHPSTPPHAKGVQGQIRQHLTTLHTRQQNLLLNPTQLHKLNVYPCTHCHTIFASVDKQPQHITKYHPIQRVQTNLAIVLQTYPIHTLTSDLQTSITTQWTHTLQWLHNLDITPLTRRNTIYHKLTPSHKKLVFAILHHIVQWCNTALKPFNSEDSTTQPTYYQTTATPFLKLLLTFESLFLSPSTTPNQSQQSFHQLLLHRHALLKASNIQQLYLDTRTPLHKPPKTPIPIFNDMQHNHAAQFAADQDNLHSAYYRIKSVTPKVTLTPHYLAILRSLYPPRRQYHPTTQHNT
jgi:hypothetical protein